MFRTLLALAAAFACGSAAAQNWPSKPVSIVVGFVPGNGPDTAARFLAERLGERTGQRFIVENKPGAFSMVAAQSVARAAPDGHTVLLSTVSAAINVHLHKNIGYDHQADFTPVTTLAMSPFMLMVNPATVPVASVAEMTGYIKARPNKLAYGGATVAGLAAGYYFSLAGIDPKQLAFIPYKGGTEALNDILGGRIHFTFMDATLGTQVARAGKLRALAITSGKRMSAVPDIPTMAESGLAGYDLVGWYALFMPARAPKEVAQKLAELANASMGTDKGREFLRSLAMDPQPGSPEEFAQFMRSETLKWGRLIKAAGIEPQ